MAFIVKKAVLAAKTVEHGEEWREFQPGVKMLLRGLTHKVVQVGLELYTHRQHAILQRFQGGDVRALSEGNTAADMTIRMLAELVIADWEGFQNEQGEEIPYSPETALAILDAPENKELFTWAVAQANSVSASAKKRLDEIKGKSLPATSGKGSGRIRKAAPKNNA